MAPHYYTPYIYGQLMYIPTHYQWRSMRLRWWDRLRFFLERTSATCSWVFIGLWGRLAWLRDGGCSVGKWRIRVIWPCWEGGAIRCLRWGERICRSTFWVSLSRLRAFLGLYNGNVYFEIRLSCWLAGLVCKGNWVGLWGKLEFWWWNRACFRMVDRV